MQNDTQLAKDELSLEQVVKLLQTYTTEKATVDLQWMANNIDYIREFCNFRVPLARNATEKELKNRQAIKAMHPGYKVRPITITNPNTYIQVKDVRIKEDLKYAIREAFRRVTQQELETDKVYPKTTVFDPEYNTQSQVQVSENPTLKKNEDLGSGEVRH